MSKTGKKKNFAESEMEVLLSEVEARKNVLFGTPSFGISSKHKSSGWESVSEAVNAVGSEKRTQVVRHEAETGCPPPKCGQNRRGDRRRGAHPALSGVVGAHVGDSD